MVAFATQVKRRRGTTAQNDAFTGAEGEIVVDTEKHTLRVHDGVTLGGFEMARQADLNDKAATSYVDTQLLSKANTDLSNVPDNYDYVVESQLPTADNDYTWYRLYKSGWLEAGGRLSGRAKTFPRAFAVPPTISISSSDTATICAVTINIYDITTTGFSGHRAQIADTWHNWVVDMSGYWMAAGVSVNTPDESDVPPQQ